MSNHFAEVCKSADGLNMVMEKYLTINSNQVVQEKREIMRNFKVKF